MIRNHYVGRTFIQPTQTVRDFGVGEAEPRPAVIAGQRPHREDSIIRARPPQPVRNLRDNEPGSPHGRELPPTRHLSYGIDFSSKGELLAAEMDDWEDRRFVGLDSIHYLSVEGMVAARA